MNYKKLLIYYAGGLIPTSVPMFYILQTYFDTNIYIAYLIASLWGSTILIPINKWVFGRNDFK